jgi:signal peptidase I
MNWLIASAECVPAAVSVGLLGLRSRYAVVRVRGNSMLPTLRPGDRLIARHGAHGPLRVGMIIVVIRPTAPLMRHDGSPMEPRPSTPHWVIKRVAALPGDSVPDSMQAQAGGATVVPEKMLLVSADNPRGSDSRIWGFIDMDRVFGPVIKGLAAPRLHHADRSG